MLFRLKAVLNAVLNTDVTDPATVSGIRVTVIRVTVIRVETEQGTKKFTDFFFKEKEICANFGSKCRTWP
jgi:hypothetical protein